MARSFTASRVSSSPLRKARSASVRTPQSFAGTCRHCKTILALQSLVNGAQLYGKPGIFVAFEESSERISANAAKFRWDLPSLQDKKLFFLDAHPNPDLILSGSFDLTG